MVRPLSIDSNGMKKGAWSEDEDEKLRSYIQRYGHWNWRLLPKFAGLKRCGKSCRLRWVNYLKPGVKRGNFSKEEQELVVELHKHLGNKWSAIAEKLPGRTDNEIKNFWHTRVEKRRKTNHHRQQIKKTANPTVVTKPEQNPFYVADSSEEKASSLSLPFDSTSPNSLSTNPEDQLEMMLSEILEADAANCAQNVAAANFAPLLEGEFDYPELRYSELSCSGSSNWMGDNVEVCGSFWNECSNSESETSSYNYTYTTTTPPPPVEEEGLLYNYDPLLVEYFGYETNLFC